VSVRRRSASLRPWASPRRGRGAARLLVLLALAVLVSAGAAGAYLSSSGSGSATASTSVALSNVTVTGAATTQSLLPTGTPTGDVNVTLTNLNSARVHINSLVLDTSQGTAGFSASASACALSFAGQSNGGSGWTIPANGTLSVDLTNSVTMGTGAASTCQGQSFTVYLKAT
jgi:hypothetical protein